MNVGYIEEIIARVDIQKIAAFLLGDVDDETDMRPYQVQIDVPQDAFMRRLNEDYPDKEACDEVFMLVMDYVTAVQKVYMEIGLQAGIKLSAQIYENMKPVNI